ncbi:MAG: 30S ribosomal protein S12 methylthiotransferase RimO [Lachnospiraceae bacterium]|nr:30S ribosomal protein S12 methylthiotransferase RimO [Lachnospiraceae bacterium]
MRRSSESRQKSPGLARIFFVSLGCDKNLVDTCQMTGLLKAQGFVITDDEDEADVVIINSCCFIGDAKQESIDTIIRFGEKKESGKIKGLIVCGCLAQRYADEIRTLLPEVDALVGTTAIDSIISAVREALLGNDTEYIEDKDRYSYVKGQKEIPGLPHSAYLKIAEGCNKNCTYCVIPGVRGHYRSVPMEDLYGDAKDLADNGVRELNLIAQETTVYGTDIYGRKSLHLLLKKLCSIEGIEWIRLLYCYPEEIYDELTECIKEEPKICHYLDLPIQHCSDRILKLMGRRTDKKSLVKTIKKLRREIPDIALRTTLISGFPSETEEEHRELLDFVKDMRFDRLGCFAYSREEGTAAYDMPGQIHHATKKRRVREIMEAQQKIAFETAAGYKGSCMRAMIEGRIPEDGVYVARTYRDAPEVDGYVFITSGRRELMTGDMVRVKIDGARGYDLTGVEM